MQKTNEAIEITAKCPLLRPGLEIKVVAVSKGYALIALHDLFEIIRVWNEEEASKEVRNA